MLGVWWAHLVDWDSGKATAKGTGLNFGALETLRAEESSFPKHETTKHSPASSGKLFPPTVLKARIAEDKE